MNSSQIYLLKRQTVNYVRSIFKKPSKYLPMLLIVAFFIFGSPFIIKLAMGEARTTDLKKLLVYIAIINITIAMPSFGTVFKMKASYWNKPDSKYIFSYPYSFSQMLHYGLKICVLSSVGASIFQIIYLIFVAKVQPGLAFLLAGLVLVLSTSFEYLVTYLLYSNEKISFEAKRKIGKTIQIGIIITIVALASTYLFLKPSMEQIAEIVMSDSFKFIPMVGWSVNIYSLVLFGPNTAGIASLLFYLAIIVILFVTAKKTKCTGKFIQPAVECMNQDLKFMNKAESGTLFASKNLSIKNKFKRNGVLSITERMATEYRRRHKIAHLDIALALVVPIIYFVTSLKTMYPLPSSSGYFAVSMIYYIVGFGLFSDSKRIGKDLNNYRVMMLPYSSLKVILTTVSYNITHSLPAFTVFSGVFLALSGLSFGLAEIISSYLSVVLLYASQLGSSILMNTGKIKSMPGIFKQGISLILMYIPFFLTIVIAAISNGLNSPALILIAPAYLAIHNLIVYILAAKNYKHNQVE